MEIKTSKSYQKEVLEKYKKEKGGEMRGYLAKPTRSQIRDACAYLLNRRNEKNDEYILNRFFEFESDVNKLRQIQNFGDGKFRSIENFLKGEVENTSEKNLNLISWLIDFQPRPLQEYLKSDDLISSEDGSPRGAKKPTGTTVPVDDGKLKTKKENGKRRRFIISISIAFGMMCLFIGIQNYPTYFSNSDPKSNSCMAWADSLYVEVSCETAPFSKFGTEVKPLNKVDLKSMKKVKVDAAYDFFWPTGKPRVWYYKNKANEIEFFTAPGLHPTNGETLKKITPYIIETYVPVHSFNANSFVNPTMGQE